MTDLAVEAAAMMPRKANGAAGQIRPKSIRPTLAALKGVSHDLVVDYEGTRVTVTYNRDALSNKDWRLIRAQIGEGEEGERKTDWVITALSRLLTGWDLYPDDTSKHPIPITEETLDDLPFGFVIAVMNGIHEAINPNSEATASGSLV